MVPPEPWCVELVRGVVAAAATPVPMPVDRFQDLLLLTSTVATDLMESDDVLNVTVTVSSEDDALEVVMKGQGANHDVSALTALALRKMSTRTWQTIDDTGLTTGFVVD